ncbi:MAG: FecR domain-containing protein [Pseudomonadota bacterium]|nr:FecR domain-containing protein [Pseudomonadota bacterium]
MMASERAEIESAAALWLERMRGPVQDSAVAARFDAWIAEDPRHVESYARMASLWQSEGLARAACATRAGNDNGGEHEDAEGGPRARAYRRWFGLVAGLASLAAAVPLAQGLFAPTHTYEAPWGTTREIALSDGSHIQLSGGSRLSVRLTPWSREADLEKGEAFFDVAHEALRGFAVEAEGARVEVLGTAFDIDVLAGGRREVRVYRGLVEVAGASGAWRLPAGTGLILDGAHVRSLEGIGGDRPGWLDGWFDAQDTRLDRLVERLNRTSRIPVVLDDPQLGELRVTGRFEMDSPQEIVETLAAIHDLSWSREEGHYRIGRP